MCGRFTLAERLEQLQKRYEIHEITYDYQPSYNIAPTDVITTVTANDTNRKSFQPINWGIPLKIEKLQNLLINIRDDKILTNGFFHKMLDTQSGSTKTPYYIKPEESIISFAGLYYKIKDDYYTAIITTKANSLVAKLHDRMPVMLTRSEEQMWLQDTTTESELLSFLNPYPSESMSYYKVSSKVNSVRNNSPDIIKPKATSSSLSDFF